MFLLEELTGLENAFFLSWKTPEFGFSKSCKVLENSVLMYV